MAATPIATAAFGELEHSFALTGSVAQLSATVTVAATALMPQAWRATRTVASCGRQRG